MIRFFVRFLVNATIALIATILTDRMYCALNPRSPTPSSEMRALMFAVLFGLNCLVDLIDDRRKARQQRELGNP